MLRRSCITTLLAALIFTLSPFASPAAQPKRPPLPPVVLQAINRTDGDGPIEDAERKVEDGESVYEITIRRNGTERSLTITAGGRLKSRQVFPGELPDAVRNTLKAQIGPNQMGEIYWTENDGEIVYEAELIKNAKKYDVSIAADGALQSIEIDLADAPEPVRKAVAAQIDKDKLESISRNVEDDEPSFYVVGTKGGKKRSLNFKPDGQLASETVTLADVPAAVQKAIKDQSIGARVGEIERIVDDGDIIFDVTTFRGELRQSFTLGDDGTLLSTQVTMEELPLIVRSAILARLANGQVLHLEKEIDDNDIAYDVQLKVHGKKLSFTLGPDGKEK